MASCDNDQDCNFAGGAITPKKLPAQGGGVEVVSTLPDIRNAQQGIIYVYFTDTSDTSTFVGAYILNAEAGALVSISGSGGGGEGHTYTFSNSSTGFKVFEDDVEIFSYTPPAYNYEFNSSGNGFKVTKNGDEVFEYTPSTYSLPIASSEVLGGVKVGDNLHIDENGVLSGNYQPATSLAYGLVKVDTTLDQNSTNPVTNAAIYAVIGDVESLLSEINGD